MWSTIKSGNVWQGEFVNKKIDGQEYIEKAVIGPLVNNQNKIINFIAVKEDITDQIKMIEALKIAKDEAEEANKVKADFLANMSHELRTPLNGILGFLSIIKEGSMSEEQREMIDVVEQSAEHLSMIINELLDFSRAEAKNMRLVENVFLISEIVDEVVKMYKNIGNEKSVMFEVENLLEKNMKIVSDEQKIKQILMNILGNAFKFTEKGSVKLKACIENELLKIVIEDSGIGISKEKMEKLYEPFVQGEHFLRKKYGGTGLGLPITKKYLDVIRGTIEVVSSQDKGTSVEILIPVKIKIEKEKSNEIIEIEDNKTLKKDIKILVAEDNEVNGRFVIKILKSLVTEVELVTNGIEVLEKMETKNYDIIFMDIQMPEMDGIEATKNIRKTNRDVFIIALTAFAGEGDREAAIFAGMNDYIIKPFTRIDIIRKIDEFLENQKKGEGRNY